MKRKLPETRSEPTAVISKSGVQSLILNEVRRAVKVTEAKMECLLEKVQRLECEPKDDLKIRKLEVHIKKVKRRGEASMAYVRKLGLNVAQTSDRPTQVSREVQVEPHALERDVKMERRPPRQSSPPSTSDRLYIKEEPSSESIAAENARREHVKAEPATPGRTVGAPPPAERGHSSSTSTLPAPGTTRSEVAVERSKATSQMSNNREVEPPSGDLAVKLERKRLREPSSPESSSTEPYSPASTPDQLFIKEEELPESIDAQSARTEHVKAEPPTPAKSGHCSSTSSLSAPAGPPRSKATVEESKVSAQRLSAAPPAREPDLPALPATAFPSMLPAAAASFSIPVKVELSLAYIQNPPQITVMWDAAEREAAAPPMDSYSVYMTMERPRASGAYAPWNMISEVRALELPMVILIKREDCMAGRRLCFAVVGKDQFGRYGPYSDVKHAVLPN